MSQAPPSCTGSASKATTSKLPTAKYVLPPLPHYLLLFFLHLNHDLFNIKHTKTFLETILHFLVPHLLLSTFLDFSCVFNDHIFFQLKRFEKKFVRPSHTPNFQKQKLSPLFVDLPFLDTLS